MNAVVRWGVPFMESLCDHSVVVEGLRPPTEFAVNRAAPWMTYPIALVLTGRPAEAVEFVKRHVEADAEDVLGG